MEERITHDDVRERLDVFNGSFKSFSPDVVLDGV